MNPGIYKLKKDIVNADFKELANCGEVINIITVSCEQSSYSSRYELELEFERFGKSEPQEAIFFEENESECDSLFKRIFTPLEPAK